MTSPENDETRLRDYALQLWARKIVVLIVFLVAVGGTLGYCVLTTSKYTGTADMLLTPTLSPTLLEANGGLTQNQVVDVPSDSQIISSSVLRSLVSKAVPHAPTATVSQVGTTDVVQISTTSTNARVASDAANQYAKAYIGFEQEQTLKTLASGTSLLQKHVATLQVAIANLNNEIAGAKTTGAAAGFQSQLNILNQENATLNQELANYEFFSSNGGGTQSGQIIGYATVPTKPSSPKTVEWTVIAAILGVLLGVGAAMLVEALSDNSRT